MKTNENKNFLLFTNFALMIAPVYSYAQQNTIVPILLYHCIEENYSDDISHLAITKEDFREHMQALKDSGYTPISFKEYSDFIEYNTPLPAKPIIITFDDGYLSNINMHTYFKGIQFKATFLLSYPQLGKPMKLHTHILIGNKQAKWSKAGLLK